MQTYQQTSCIQLKFRYDRISPRNISENQQASAKKETPNALESILTGYVHSHSKKRTWSPQYSPQTRGSKLTDSIEKIPKNPSR